MSSDTETWEIDVQKSSHREVVQSGDNGPFTISFTCQNDKKASINNGDVKTAEANTSTYTDRDKGRTYSYDDGIQDNSKKKVKKTKICGFYRKNGECRFEDKCKFSHDVASVSTPNNNKANVSPTTDERCHTPFDNNTNLSDESYLNISSSNDKPCTFFKAQTGCKYGDSCSYAHYRSVGDAGNENSEEECEDGGWQEESFVSDQETEKTTLPNKSTNNKRTCSYFQTRRGCLKGDQCDFSHPLKDETHHSQSPRKGDDEMRYTRSPRAGNDEMHYSRSPHTGNDEMHYSRSPRMGNDEMRYSQSRKGNDEMRYSQSRKGNDETRYVQPPRKGNDEVHGQSHRKGTDDTSIAKVNAARDTNCSHTNNSNNEKICHFFLKRRGCRLKDKCPFLHDSSRVNDAYDNELDDTNVTSNENDTNITSNETDANVTRNETDANVTRNEIDANVTRNEKCSLDIIDNVLSEMNISRDEQEHLNTKETDSRHHPSAGSLDEKEQMKVKFDSEIQVVDISGKIQKEEVIPSISNKKPQENEFKSPCRFYLSPKGCFRGQNCTFLHPERDGGNDNVEDYIYLQDVEYNQLEKRFCTGDKCTLLQREPSRVYSVIFEPTDPDWGIVVKEFELIVEFPADYPKQLFNITLEEKEFYPERFTGFMNDGIDSWIKARAQERDEKDLAFRPFLKWFDRNAEELVLEAGKKVKQLRDAESCGITLVSHNEIIVNNPTIDSHQNDREDDHEQPFEEFHENNNVAASVNVMMSTENKLSNGHGEKLSTKVKVGTEMKFTHLEMSENVATMLLKNILLVVQCARCRTRSEFNLPAKRKSSIPCKKCHVNMSATFHPELVHQYSHVSGYLHLEGCKAFDVVLVDSIVTVNCLNCSRDHTKKGIAYGRKGEHWCEHCHTKMEIQIMSTKFTQLQKNGEKLQVVKVVTKKPVKHPGIKEGTPLPERGACKHYKKSFRWMRFPCCGKVYPCDICHEEGEENDHEMKYATRMICGHCSKEQPFSKEKPCTSCNANLTKSRSTHWEGGKGCRNKVTMSRTDNKKTAGLGKTISRKKADS